MVESGQTSTKKQSTAAMRLTAAAATVLADAEETKEVDVPDFSKLKPVPIETKTQLKEILPKAGLVYSEKALLSEALCKPKLLPLKSETLLKLEKMEHDLAQQ